MKKQNTEYDQEQLLTAIPTRFAHIVVADACPSISDQHTCIHLRLSNDAVTPQPAPLGRAGQQAFASARLGMKN